MSIFEYDEEKHLKNEREFEYQRGHEVGMREGMAVGHKAGHEAGVREGMAAGHKAGHEAGVKEGMAVGHKAGKQEGESRVNALILKLIESGRNNEIEKAVTDKAYQEKLFKEFNL